MLANGEAAAGIMLELCGLLKLLMLLLLLL
jgi:hypothetical protein